MTSSLRNLCVSSSDTKPFWQRIHPLLINPDSIHSFQGGCFSFFLFLSKFWFITSCRVLVRRCAKVVWTHNSLLTSLQEPPSLFKAESVIISRCSPSGVRDEAPEWIFSCKAACICTFFPLHLADFCSCVVSTLALSRICFQLQNSH